MTHMYSFQISIDVYVTKITSSKSQEFWMDGNFQWQLPSPDIYHPKSSFTCTYAGLINILQPYSHHWCTPQTNYTLMIPSDHKISDTPVTYQIDKPMRYQIPLLPKISYESYLENFNCTHTQTDLWLASMNHLFNVAHGADCKNHLHVFSYIYPFLSHLPFLLATVLSCFFSLV